MNTIPSLDQLTGALQKCAKALADEIQSVTDPALREQLQTLAGDLQKNQAILQAEHPKMLADIKGSGDKVKQSAQQSLDEAKQLQARIEAMKAAPPKPKAAPPAPAATPKVAVDPALGATYRAELLGWFAKRDGTTVQPPRKDEGSVADFGLTEFERETRKAGNVEKKPTKPEPPKKPAAPKKEQKERSTDDRGKEVWEPGITDFDQ